MTFSLGIPTLIVAVAGICDAISVALFGILSSLMFATGGLAFQISQGNVNFPSYTFDISVMNASNKHNTKSMKIFKIYFKHDFNIFKYPNKNFPQRNLFIE